MNPTLTEPLNVSEQFCPNLTCCARGKIGEGNIVVHGRKRPRYKCKTCGRTFSAKTGTAFAGLRKSTEVIVIVVTLLAYGCPLQAIVHAFGLDERTVASWRDRAGKHCEQVHQAMIEQEQLDLIHMSPLSILTLTDRKANKSQRFWERCFMIYVLISPCFAPQESILNERSPFRKFLLCP
jgi:transposase-like protein